MISSNVLVKSSLSLCDDGGAADLHLWRREFYPLGSKMVYFFISNYGTVVFFSGQSRRRAKGGLDVYETDKGSDSVVNCFLIELKVGIFREVTPLCSGGHAIGHLPDPYPAEQS